MQKLRKSAVPGDYRKLYFYYCKQPHPHYPSLIAYAHGCYCEVFPPPRPVKKIFQHLISRVSAVVSAIATNKKHDFCYHFSCSCARSARKLLPSILVKRRGCMEARVRETLLVSPLTNYLKWKVENQMYCN